jgi:O-methyltransferase
MRSLWRRIPQIRHLWQVERFFHPQYESIKDLTMVSPWTLRDLIWRVDHLTQKGVEGAYVECGTWRGGASFLMAKRLAYLGIERPVWMFDSFEGLPEPAEIDGPGAKAWAQDTSSPIYFDNCRANVDQVWADAARLGLEKQVRIVKGWFDETLPKHRDEIGKIALLRLDGDWYESVTTCLDVLFEAVEPGGIVLIDDYYAWDGASRAIHDYLSAHKSTARIRTTLGPYPTAYLQIT